MTPDGRADLVPNGNVSTAAGDSYSTRAYDFHRTERGGEAAWRRSCQSAASIQLEPTLLASTALSRTRTSIVTSGHRTSSGKLSPT